MTKLITGYIKLSIHKDANLCQSATLATFCLKQGFNSLEGDKYIPNSCPWAYFLFSGEGYFFSDDKEDIILYGEMTIKEFVSGEPKYVVGQTLSNSETTIEIIEYDVVLDVIRYKIEGGNSIGVASVRHIEDWNYKLVKAKSKPRKKSFSDWGEEYAKAIKESQSVLTEMDSYYIGQEFMSKEDQLMIVVIESATPDRQLITYTDKKFQGSRYKTTLEIFKSNFTPRKTKKRHIARDATVSIGGMEIQSMVNPLAYYAEKDPYTRQDKVELPEHFNSYFKKKDSVDVTAINIPGTIKHMDITGTLSFTGDGSQLEHEQKESAMIPRVEEVSLPVAPSTMMNETYPFGYRTKLV